MDETDNLDKETEETVKMGGGASNFKPWLFQPGKSGNPKGRPPGTKSLKAWVKDYLHNLPEEEKVKFISGMPKDIIWRMGEGQPHQSTDTEVKGVLKLEFHESLKKEATKEALKKILQHDVNSTQEPGESISQ